MVSARASDPTPTPASGPWRPLLWGTAALLVAAELGFRLLGVVLDRDGSSSDGATHTVLAEGDSFTYGIGGLSYPEQLESMLDTRAGSPDAWRVIKKGVPGFTSVHVLDRLRQDLATHHPDVVLVVIGENNRWNSVTLDRYEDTGWLAALDRTLLHSRVYKFVKIAAIGWSHGTFHEWAAAESGLDPLRTTGDGAERLGLPTSLDALDLPALAPDATAALRKGFELQLAGDYEGARAALEAFTAGWPEEPQGYLALGTTYSRLGQSEDALRVLELGRVRMAPLQAAARPRSDRDLYFALGLAHDSVGHSDDAQRVWTEGLTRWPDDPDLFLALADLWALRGDDPFAAADELGKIPGVPENPLFDELAQLRDHVRAQGITDVDALVDANLYADTQAMIDVARQHDASIVFATYPSFAYDGIRRAATEAGVPYVDLRPLFEALFEGPEQFLSSDGCHCNTLGYAVMAAALQPVVEAVVRDEPVPVDLLPAAQAVVDAWTVEHPDRERPEDVNPEHSKTVGDVVADAQMRTACEPIRTRMIAKLGPEFDYVVGAKLRTDMLPADVVEMCHRFVSMSDADVVDELSRRLDLGDDLRRMGQ